MDLLHGKLTSKLILFALPIALSSMLQQLFNFADTAVVGRFADATALAAVGTNTEIIALIVSIFTGLTVGTNVRIASMIGRGKTEHVPTTVKASLELGLVLGLLLAVLGQPLAAPILRSIHTPESILPSATLYLQIYLLGAPFLLLYNFGAAVLRSFGDSKRPLQMMTIAGIINVLLNLVLVIVFHLGVSGVAIATDVSTAFSAVFVLYLLKKENLLQIHGRSTGEGVLLQDKNSNINLSLHTQTTPKSTANIASSSNVLYPITKADILRELSAILQIGIPAALQGSVFCFANIFMQSAVNSFGEVEIAGAAIAMNFEYFTYYVVGAFGQAVTTFVGQNYAAGYYDRCRKIVRSSILFGFMFCGMLTTPVVLLRTPLSALFSSDSAVIAASAFRLLFLFSEPICAVYETISGAFRGMERPILPTIEMILGICVLRIAWIELVTPRFGTQACLYFSFPLTWFVTATALSVSYLVMAPKVLPDTSK